MPPTGSSRAPTRSSPATGTPGLTTAKVAAASGENKALITYYFGSKQGLVAAVARLVSERLTAVVLGEIDEAHTPRELVEALADGLWRIMDRDPGLQRVYFDLSSQAVVEPEIGGIMIEMKQGHRAILREVLRGLELKIPPNELDAIAVYVISGLEGLSLERLDRGDSAGAARAREIFIESATAAIERHPRDARAPVIALLRKAFALRPPVRLRVRLLRWIAGAAVREFAWGMLAATILVADRGTGRARAADSTLGVVCLTLLAVAALALARLAWQSLTSARAVREVLAELEPPADERALRLPAQPPAGAAADARGRAGSATRAGSSTRALAERRCGSTSTCRAGAGRPAGAAAGDHPGPRRWLDGRHAAPSRASRCSTTSPSTAGSASTSTIG